MITSEQFDTIKPGDLIFHPGHAIETWTVKDIFPALEDAGPLHGKRMLTAVGETASQEYTQWVKSDPNHTPTTLVIEGMPDDYFVK